MDTMATFLCAECDAPYCGGRVDCISEQQLSSGDLHCDQCQWNAQNGKLADHRCKLHGHRFAVFKCDFCCDIAAWRCFGTTNFCERCHLQAGSDRYYPCPGGYTCSLCIPHPAILSEDGDGAIKSFVLGCNACRGCADMGEVFQDVDLHDCEFGYPDRVWKEFAGGDMLLAGVGEREVRHRLKHRESGGLHDGGAVECAERLWLAQMGIENPTQLLAAPGSGRGALARRLEAVGLRQEGDRTELAERLLLLRDSRVEALDSCHHEACVDDLPPLETLDVCHCTGISPRNLIGTEGETISGASLFAYQRSPALWHLLPWIG